MPIINGLKMACEPCIRGHRSTKCNHASERLMVPVRKPGRPLSMCPHPPARLCGCAGVTAAIPRRQTCHCGPPRPAAAPNGIDAGLTPTFDSLLNLPKTSSGPSRIQKTTKAPARKQSIDLTNLERMDPVHVNMLPSFDDRTRPDEARAEPGTESVQQPPLPQSSVGGDFAGIPLPAMGPRDGGAMGQMMYPMYPQPMATPILNHHERNGVQNGMDGVNGHTSMAGLAHVSPPTAASHDAPILQRRRGSSMSNGVDATTGSCCQGPPASPTVQKPPAGLGATPQMAANGDGALDGMSPMEHHSPFQPYFPQPTIFTYPPHYGSYLNPLMPELWRQAMAFMMAGGMNPAQMAAAAAAAAVATAATTGPNGQPNMGYGPDETAPQTPTMGVSHTCTCGDSCQCVGCAAHPYNDATQNYVRSACNAMNQDGWGSSGMAAAASQMVSLPKMQRPTTTTTTTTTTAADIAATTNATAGSPRIGGGGGGGGSCCGGNGQEKASPPPPPPKSPTPAAAGAGAAGPGHSPSDSGSLASEDQQTLSASDFFFVTYPFSDACMGETASCPCGDDCQCLGCVVHGNPSVPDPAASSSSVAPAMAAGSSLGPGNGAEPAASNGI